MYFFSVQFSIKANISPSPQSNAEHGTLPVFVYCSDLITAQSKVAALSLQYWDLTGIEKSLIKVLT